MLTNQPYNEPAILQRLAEGDEHALSALIGHYAPILAPFIFNFTKSAGKTEEIIQDIFMQVWLARGSIAEVNNLKSFLYVIAKNHALNAVRSFLREQKRLKNYQALQDDGYHDEEAEPRLQWIEEAIGRLPAQQKKVWLLSRRYGKKYSEIAEEMNISRETVKTYLQYANASIMKYVREKVTIVLAGLLLLKNI